MRTTIDLPGDLVSEAIEVTGIQTKTAVITLALKNLIQNEKIATESRSTQRDSEGFNAGPG